MSYADFVAFQQQSRNTTPDPNSTTSVTPAPRSANNSMPIHMEVEDLVEDDGRDKITKLDETLKTGTWFGYKNKITKRILWMFQTTMDEVYTKYRHIPETKKESFFRAFAQEYTWKRGQTTRIRRLYHQTARRVYSTYMHLWKKKWRNGEDPPSHLAGKKAWDDLIEYWKTDKAIKTSTRNSKNRNSNRGGKGPATQNGGARSIKQRIVDLTNELGEEPDWFTLVKDRHTNKKTNVISDPVVADYVSQIEEAANIRLSQLSMDGAVASTLPTSEMNEIVAQKMPINKGCRFGLGEVSEFFEAAYSSQKHTVDLEQEIERLREIEREKDARIKTLEDTSLRMSRFLESKFGGEY